MTVTKKTAFLAWLALLLAAGSLSAGTGWRVSLVGALAHIAGRISTQWDRP